MYQMLYLSFMNNCIFFTDNKKCSYVNLLTEKLKTLLFIEREMPF